MLNKRRNLWGWVLAIGGVFSILITTFLIIWFLLYYQSSDVVFRITYPDGRVEVIGGRVPWRQPDFMAEGGVRVDNRGNKTRLKKTEIWFREARARKRLVQMFRALQQYSEQHPE